MDKISNSILTVEISEHGAELQSIKKNGKEYLWQGDAKFWGRRSPVLFPNVGRVWNDQYRHAGNTYEIGQHGFARDMDFQVTYKDDDGIVYWLESTPDPPTRPGIWRKLSSPHGNGKSSGSPTRAVFPSPCSLSGLFCRVCTIKSTASCGVLTTDFPQHIPDQRLRCGGSGGNAQHIHSGQIRQIIRT